MTDKYYDAENHYFNNETGSTVYIKPAPGQTLNIQGTSTGAAGLDTEVMYNDGGFTAGDSTFTFNKTDKVLSAKEVKTELVKSTISQGSISVQLNNLENLTQALPTEYKEQGISVSIADNTTTTYALAGAPFQNLGIGTFFGGGLVYESISNAPFTLEGEYSYTVFCDDAYAGEFSDINEEGDYFVYSAVSSTSFIELFKKTASWGSDGVITGFGVCKISSDRLLVSGTTEQVSVYVYNGTSWSVEHVMEAPGSIGNIPIMEIINTGLKAFYYLGTDLKIWTRVGTVWTNTNTLSIAGILGISAIGNLLVYHTSTGVVIMEDEVQVASFSQTGITSTTCTTDLVFFSTATNIYSVNRVTGTWVLNASSVSNTDIQAISCNTNRLIAGRPNTDTAGRCAIYTIIDFNGTLIENCLIDINSPDIQLTSTYGEVDINASNNINLSGSKVFVNSDLQLDNDRIYASDGTQTLPSLSFVSNPDAGLYRTGNNLIGFCVGGTLRFSVSNTYFRLRVPTWAIDGTATAPVYAFFDDQDSGMYSSAPNEVSVSCNGVQSLEITENSVNVPRDLNVTRSLTSANGFFRAVASVNQNILNNVSTLVNAYWGTPTITGDVDAPITYSAGVATVNKTGTYLINFGVVYNFRSGADRRVDLLLNGATAIGYDESDSTTFEPTVSSSVVYNLTAGDNLSVFTDQNSGITLTLQITHPIAFSIYRLG